MSETSEIGAKKIEYQEFTDKATSGIALRIPVDVRVCLAIIAQHVYCVDGSSDYFDVPGFEMLSKIELVELLNSTKQTYNADTITTGLFGNSSENKPIAVKKYNKNSNNQKPSIYNFGSEDPDIEVWLQEIMCSNGKSYCGLMGHSGFKAAIYKQKKNGDRFEFDTHRLGCSIEGLNDLPKYIFACSGSDAPDKIMANNPNENTFDDWVNTNANQALFDYVTYSIQYKIAYVMGSFLAEKVQNNIMVVGHSLGGGLASAFSVGAKCKAITFNAAGLNKASLAQYMTYPHTNNLNRLLNLKAFFVGRNNKNYIRIKEQERNVQAYCSTTDVLTNSQNNTGMLLQNNNYLGLFSSMLTPVVAVLRITPIIGHSVKTDPIIPVTYGNLTYVKTKNSRGVIRWLNPISKKINYNVPNYKGDLINCSESIGHAMSMLIDGLILAIHDVNNLMCSFQEGDLRNNLNSLFCEKKNEGDKVDGLVKKYSIGPNVAKVSCQSCHGACLWYYVRSWKNKCVYQALETSVTQKETTSDDIFGTVYEIAPKLHIRNNSMHNKQSNTSGDIEFESETEFDNLLLKSCYGDITNEMDSNKKIIQLKERLKKYGKDNNYAV